jgi:hypothetical protein
VADYSRISSYQIFRDEVRDIVNTTILNCEHDDRLRATLRTLTWNNLIRGNGEIVLKPREELNRNVGMN